MSSRDSASEEVKQMGKIETMPPIGKCAQCHRPIRGWEDYYTCVEDGSILCAKCMEKNEVDKIRHFLGNKR